MEDKTKMTIRKFSLTCDSGIGVPVDGYVVPGAPFFVHYCEFAAPSKAASADGGWGVTHIGTGAIIQQAWLEPEGAVEAVSEWFGSLPSELRESLEENDIEAIKAFVVEHGDYPTAALSARCDFTWACDASSRVVVDRRILANG